MVKKLGILLLFMALVGVCTPTYANSVQLKDNLNLKIAPIAQNINDQVYEKKVDDETIKDIPLILNDRVLNLMLQPRMKTRPDGIIYTESQLTIDVVDPKLGVNANNGYPGLRGPNQLVIYTPNYGLRTGTNEFGTEAIIVDNMVIQLNGADSIIPKNGFVISGHGKAKNWILKIFKLVLKFI